MSPSNPPKIKGIDLSPALTPSDRVQLFLKTDVNGKANYSGFDKDLIQNDLKLVSAAPGEVVFELIVKEAHTNRLGNMHGGCAALIFDICTTAALVPSAREGFWEFLGVTRNLNVTYLRPAPLGAKVIITATVVQAGRQLATIRGVMRNEEDGKICSTVEHLKFNAVPSEPKL